jgi:tetratricopeptide (TPR) repeat protein
MSDEPIDMLEIVEEEVPLRFRQASEILEKATGGGATVDPNLLYMLAIAYKRQNKVNEARAALRKIPKPDANVMLQMALLSLRERNFAQAEGELLRAWQMDPSSYEIGYDLLLTQLTLGKTEECFKLIPNIIQLLDRNPNTKPEDKRLMLVMGAVLKVISKGGSATGDASLSNMNAQDEQNILKIFRTLGQLDTTMRLLETLSAARPNSGPIREAYIEAVLVKARDLIDKCAWTEAEMILRPLAKDRSASRAHQVALINMLGVCCCLTQCYDEADTHFAAAAKLVPNDARIRQNQALNCELAGNSNDAEKFWERFLDLMGNKLPAPPDLAKYQTNLEFEALNRLAVRHADKERWNDAISYIKRAVAIKPEEGDALEKLFFFTRNAKKYGEARRALDRLRDIRPNDPQLELYELDLIEVKSLGDIEKLLTEIDAILRRYPDDPRVRERAINMVGDVIPLMGNLCDQLTDQMGKVINQVRDLPQYQINWSAVRDVMRDLLKEFQKLRRITGKCLPLVESEDHKRIIRDLADHIDKKMEACRSMGA